MKQVIAILICIIISFPCYADRQVKTVKERDGVKVYEVMQVEEHVQEFTEEDLTRRVNGYTDEIARLQENIKNIEDAKKETEDMLKKLKGEDIVE